MNGPPLRWQWLHWQSLTLDDLYDLLALRGRVFVVEQGPYLDPDGLDRHAWHLLGRDADGALQACLRAVDPARRYAERSIGRVAVSLPWRGRGVGRELMVRGLTLCDRAWPGEPIRISAQAHLQPFYGGLGFVTVGEVYLEDGIEHVQMLRPAQPPEPAGGQDG